MNGNCLYIVGEISKPKDIYYKELFFSENLVDSIKNFNVELHFSCELEKRNEKNSMNFYMPYNIKKSECLVDNGFYLPYFLELKKDNDKKKVLIRK